ncbi:unnamed protein product, partial [Ilex paraguariensis]
MTETFIVITHISNTRTCPETQKKSLITITMSSFKFSDNLLFLSMFCFFTLLQKVLSQAPLAHNCPNTTTYTPNSTYADNLNSLLSNLTSNATGDTGFYNFTSGRNPPDMAYGLFLCRGDVTVNDCRECVASASTEILRRCPIERRSTIWYDNCLMRYSNESIYSIPDMSVGIILSQTQNVTNQEEMFNQVLGALMSDIATRASNDQSGKKFATGEANFTALQNLSGLGQCTPDLSISQCNTCLRNGISSLPIKQGARVLFPSCNIRYEMYPFFQAVAPPPASLPPPPSSPSSEG